MIISSREGAHHGSASGVERANGPEQEEGKGKRKASTAGWPAGSRTSRRGRADRAIIGRREHEWLERLTADPASFAAVELEVHEQARRQADLYVAGLLAKASEQAETAPHIDNVINAAEVPLRAVEKKDARWWCGFWEDWRSR